MDAWQKPDIANKQRDSETKFVEIAAPILSRNPTANKTPESTKLRTSDPKGDHFERREVVTIGSERR